MRRQVATEAGYGPLRVALYGDPKTGKTRLATTLPWGPLWGERAVYVAWDPDSDRLDSVPLVDRARFEIVTPEKEKMVKTPKGVQKVFDPLTEAVNIATYDWQSEGFGTIIWDTMSATAQDLLAASAWMNLYADPSKVPALGVPGTLAYVPQTGKGDYGMAQRSTMYVLQFLLQQPINVIIIFHAQADDNDGRADMVGGPATVGKAGIEPVAALFNNLFRVTQAKVRVGNTVPPVHAMKRMVYTEKKGYWMAGMRSPHVHNPMPEFDIDGEKTLDFWRALDGHLRTPTEGAK